MASRPALVVAALTMLRAYVVAGRPVSLTPMGSFADWDWVRGTLVWLGCDDPAATRGAILDDDPRKSDLLDVMDLWTGAFGTTDYVEVGEIERRAAHVAAAMALRDKLIEVACRGGKWSGKSVGWWLRGHKERVVAGRRFDCRAGAGHVQTWKLTEVVVAGQPELPGTA